MNAHAQFFREAADRFTAVVHATTDWSAASPCRGWTAADVVDHVVDTEREFLTRHGVDLGPRPDGAPPEVWSAHLAALEPLLADDSFWESEFDGHFGRTTIGEALERFYGFDLLVHGWDLGVANGRPTTFTEADMDAMEASFEVFGEAMYADGVFAPPLEVPAAAPRQTRLLARMGRAA